MKQKHRTNLQTTAGSDLIPALRINTGTEMHLRLDFSAFSTLD